MKQRLQEHLSQDLPMLKPVDQTDIAHLMVGGKTTRTVEALTASLVTSKVEIGTLLSALLRYQWMVIQDLMKSIKPENINTQLHAFSLCIERFGKLQSSIVVAFDQSWRAELEKEVSVRVLAECNAQWLLSDYVHLHNYFNEIPVVAKAKYHSFDGIHLSLLVTPEVGRVFACKDDINEAILISPDRRHRIAVGVIDCRKGILTLVIRCVQPAMRECRENVRIRLADAMDLMIKRHDGVMNGCLIDVSASGLRLEVSGGVAIHAGENLTCAWMLDEKKIMAEAEVRWANADGDICRAGVKFKALGPCGEQVRAFMFAQQQQLAARLKQLGAPAWMKER